MRIKDNIKLRLSNKNRQRLGGYLFTLPFTIGFIIFFLFPFFQAIIYSLNKIEFSKEGYSLMFQGFDNYRYILLVHPKFIRVFTETVLVMFRDLPLILSFSLFAAVILNQRFRGRFVARAIFFLPVILSSGVIIYMEQYDVASLMAQNQTETTLMFSGEALRTFLMDMKLPEEFLYYVLVAVNGIPSIIRASGIQILIFLAGLQSIPNSIYESARIEGASSWEEFWLITFPMVSPLIITNTVYTIVDSFTSMDNRLIMMIKNTTFGGKGFGVSMAMSILYFLAIFAFLWILYKFIENKVFYNV
ncbi:MAG: carbohydrate ABC transporter permease [Bacillota bacterium]